MIDWPILDDEARERLSGTPICDIAVKTEGKAGLHVETHTCDEASDTGAKAIDIDADLADLNDICPAENDRRIAGCDTRLLRPKTVPFMVGLARRLLRARGSIAAAA